MVASGGAARDAWAAGLAGYRDIVLVGHGRHSVVYRAYQERPTAAPGPAGGPGSGPGAGPGTDVVIKVFVDGTDNRGDPSDDPAARATFDRERPGLTELTGHDALVSVLDAGYTDAGRPFVVMEVMAGGSLAERLTAVGPLGTAEAVDVGVRIAGGLEAAHRAGILHRDVEPDNLLVSARGDVKLAGFAVSALHGGGASAVYAAPEVLAGHPATAASDQYGLAATLVALLYRRPSRERPAAPDPTAATGLVMVTSTVAGRVADLRASGTPEPVCAVLERALSRNPQDRYPSVEAFGDALVAARGGPRREPAVPPPARSAAATAAVVAATRPSVSPPGVAPEAVAAEVAEPPFGTAEPAIAAPEVVAPDAAGAEPAAPDVVVPAAAIAEPPAPDVVVPAAAIAEPMVPDAVVAESPAAETVGATEPTPPEPAVTEVAEVIAPETTEPEPGTAEPVAPEAPGPAVLPVVLPIGAIAPVPPAPSVPGAAPGPPAEPAFGTEAPAPPGEREPDQPLSPAFIAGAAAAAGAGAAGAAGAVGGVAGAGGAATGTLGAAGAAGMPPGAAGAAPAAGGSGSRRRAFAILAGVALLLAASGGLAYALSGNNHHTKHPAATAAPITPLATTVPTTVTPTTKPHKPKPTTTLAPTTVAPTTAAPVTTTPTTAAPPPPPPAAPKVQVLGPSVVEDNSNVSFRSATANASTGQWSLQGSPTISVQNLHWSPSAAVFTVHPGCEDVGHSYVLVLTVAGPGGTSSASHPFNVVDTNHSCG